MFKAFGKAGWVDERIEFAEWPELKPTTPLGSLPFLTLPDGRVVSQTDAMMRWAGRRGRRRAWLARRFRPEKFF